jgi:hypothetical protein
MLFSMGSDTEASTYDVHGRSKKAVQPRIAIRVLCLHGFNTCKYLHRRWTVLLLLRIILQVRKIDQGGAASSKKSDKSKL